MINRKTLTVFLVLTFGLAWIFFLIPLLFRGADLETRQLLTTVFFSAGMWMPGLSAILVTLFVKKEPFGSLNLKRLADFPGAGDFNGRADGSAQPRGAGPRVYDDPAIDRTNPWWACGPPGFDRRHPDTCSIDPSTAVQHAFCPG
jgi:hypothetical protein